MDLVNWGGNYAYRAKALHEPASVDELRRVVAAATSIRAVGTRHSFNDIGDADELVSLARMPQGVHIDREAMVVVAPAGMTYGALAETLASDGLALHAMASLPHISVGGAIQTGTHGSGDRAGCLSTAVRAVEMVTSEGDIVTAKRGDDRFEGMVVGLGALGVVTRLALDVEPAYDVRQWVYRDLSWETFAGNVDAITAAADSVSLFTDWGDSIDQAWLKQRVRDAEDESSGEAFFGARAAGHQMHPVADHPADACTAQLGVPGPWHQRLPHFRMGATPSSGEEIQSEYLVGRSDLVPALEALRALAPRIRPHLLVSEIRTVAADDLWLSMAHERESAGIHFTWKREAEAVAGMLPLIEDALAPFAPRPHWGKTFAMEVEVLSERYPRLEAFRALQHELDYRGAFRNSFMGRRVLG
jgi:alditol oxidase